MLFLTIIKNCPTHPAHQWWWISKPQPLQTPLQAWNSRCFCRSPRGLVHPGTERNYPDLPSLILGGWQDCFELKSLKKFVEFHSLSCRLASRFSPSCLQDVIKYFTTTFCKIFLSSSLVFIILSSHTTSTRSSRGNLLLMYCSSSLLKFLA